MGSPVSREISKNSQSEEDQETHRINIEIMNEKLQQTKIETQRKAQQAKIETERKAQQAKIETEQEAEKLQQTKIETERKVQQAKIETEQEAEKLRQTKIETDEKKIKFRLFVTGCVTLAMDHFLRGTRYGRKFCVKLRLNISPSRFFDRTLVTKTIIEDKAREAVIDTCAHMKLPSILIGPSGCGKSTLLLQIINRVKFTQKNFFLFPRLTAFVSLRNISSVTLKASSDREIAENMLQAANNLFNSIGYPVNISMLSRMSIKSFAMFGSKIDITSDRIITNRMKEALDILFECMNEARGFIVLDEVHDLIRNDRLAQSGGCEVFHYLAYLLVVHIVNNQRVQGVLAGSSNYLLKELDKTVVGPRLYFTYIQDFDKSLVLSYLENSLKIPADAATYIIDKCGTRLRLLDRFIRISNLAEAQLGVTAQDIAANELVKEFYALSNKLPELLVTMKNIVDGKSMYVKDLPKDLQLVDYIGKILYVGPGSQIYFQNKVIERAWVKFVETLK